MGAGKDIGSPVDSATRIGDERRPFEHGGTFPLVLVEEPLVDRPQQTPLQRTTVTNRTISIEGQRGVIGSGGAGDVAKCIGTYQRCLKISLL